MDRLTFGMRVLNITQSGTMLDGRPNMSHPNMALDLAGSNSGIDPYLNLEADTCFYCSGAFGTVSTGNTRFFVTCDEVGRQKKVLCADGVVTLGFMNGNTGRIMGCPEQFRKLMEKYDK